MARGARLDQVVLFGDESDPERGAGRSTDGRATAGAGGRPGRRADARADDSAGKELLQQYWLGCAAEGGAAAEAANAAAASG
ncbi:MAG: hypothetical protein R2742_15520 [Micropruina glycogenica]